MKRLLLILAVVVVPLLMLTVGCKEEQSKLSIAERALLAMPADAFTSIASSLTDKVIRDSLIKEGNAQWGANEDLRHFALERDEYCPNELAVLCFQDPLFDFVQIATYKMKAPDDWFILVSVGEQIDEMPMRSLKMSGYVFNAKKGTMTSCGLKSEPYNNIEFYDPVLSWPYLKGADDVESVLLVANESGYYLMANPAGRDEDSPVLNPMPFALKYTWNGEEFKRDGYGPSFGFVDNLAAFSVTDQPLIPYDYEFPGCRMEMTSEEGYNNLPVRHYDLYQGDEHLIRLDPFPAICDNEEGRAILMQVISYSPRYKTTEGLGVGSLMKDVEESKTFFGMEAGEFKLSDVTTDDGRPALRLTYPGFEAEFFFVSDGEPEPKVAEVLIRPEAKG